ncbi:MAG: hypothetical protein AXW15_05785 [Neptuniibacter sp. Phe_28]|jgi:predicted RNase H-like HicB family nuclease|nr:MAG: hypothetical protein AXW15_05785 [Neptuniibacter sp. Phe_28]
MFYPIVIHQEGDSAYGVTVPDLPGCFSAGDSLNKALINAKKAIKLHIESLLEDGESIPEGCELSRYTDDPKYSDGLWHIVEV